MRAFALGILFVSLTLSLFAVETRGAVDTLGGLIAPNPLACVPVTTVTPAHTAIDVVVGARECALADRYADASELMLIATAYAFFDTRRVRGASAHAALNTMFNEATAGLPATAMDTLTVEMDRLNADIGRKLRACDHLRTGAPPSYAPEYMVERGQEKSVQPRGPALVADFDAAEAWSQALTFVKCTE
jgi:hypothetical protein